MRRLLVTAIAAWFALALIVVACGDAADTTTTTGLAEATNVTTQPPATSEPPTTTPPPATITPPATTRAPTTTVAPATTVPESTTTTSAVSADQVAAAVAVGDIAAGEDLFHSKLAAMRDSVSCSSCHSLDGKESPWAPTLPG